jgi:ribose 5-phosphate isomerase A
MCPVASSFLSCELSRVDKDLNCIKGGGACHLREKVLAEAADTWVIVADYRKNSEVLGTNVSIIALLFQLYWIINLLQWKQGVPVEVAPFAYAKVLHNLRTLGSTKPKLRMAKMKAGPIVSDNGNFIIDAPFPEQEMSDPLTVCISLRHRPTSPELLHLPAPHEDQDAHWCRRSWLVRSHGQIRLFR